uniref:Cold-inducible RNA-binding protein n=1 Tax=Tanacetum cinerariifolium TaxID=118510 RepID=A0A6L2MSE8_TANCI|nr:cold-inducible RNA-binding protein [Tanacetum cinerariifolium]
MAYQQLVADVHPDELYLPNKRYDLMDANKKIDLEHVQCPPESKILTNIIKNHSLGFSIAASSSVPWIYMAQFWHTLKEDGSKYGLKFMLDKKELSLTLDDFKTIFHLPQATDNNHDSFVSPPSFSDMIPFYKNHLGFTMELKTPSSFKTTGLLQPWQMLCKIFFKCLTTRVTGWDQPPLQIIQMLYCFINNIHVDYAELLWEEIHYSLLHSTSSISYPRFTKIIIGHYMTNFPEISRRARDKYHNLKDDDLMKNIFNLRKYKDKVGMKIPDWMITEAMKQTEHYRMYVEVFGIDVPLIQSPPTESTQGTHRTPSAPRSPTSKVDASAPTRSTVIRLRLPQQRSTHLTPPAPVLTVDKADELILQDTLQVSLVEHKSRQEQEARENVALVEKHLPSEDIEKMKDGQEHVVDDSSIPRNDERNILGTRLEPRGDKESPEVGITDVIVPVNVYDEEEEEDEITDEKLMVTTQSSNSPKSFVTLADHLHEAMIGSLPTMVDKHIEEQVQQQVPEQVRNQVPVYVAEGLILERQKNEEEMEKMIAKAILQEYDPQLQQQDIAIWLALQIKFERLQVSQTTCRTLVVHPRDQDDPHDDAHPEGEKSAKRQKTFEYETYVSGESSSGQDNEQEQGPSTSGNQEQADDYDFWTDSYASDDDEIPTKQVSQDIMEEVSLNVDEAKLKKIVDEMLRQRCTSGDEHQYHVDQMKNFLKSDIVWESHKEILVSPHPRKTTPLVLSCQRDPEAPTLSLINQDLLANDCIVSITELDFKNLNKNDIEDMYLMIINGKVPDYAETGLLWSLSVFIRSSVIWERVHDFQLGIESYQQKPMHGIIYKNSKKEKRVMRHSETHKFCDATLNRVLEGLKSYNNDVRYGYNQRDLTKYEVEYLKLFEEEIDDRLKYRRQMRRDGRDYNLSKADKVVALIIGDLRVASVWLVNLTSIKEWYYDRNNIELESFVGFNGLLQMANRFLGSQLFISRLSFYTTNKELKRLFSPFGAITEARLVVDPKTQRPKGFGFVTFESDVDAQNALKAMNGKIVNGGLIFVEFAKTKTPEEIGDTLK